MPYIGRFFEKNSSRVPGTDKPARVCLFPTIYLYMSVRARARGFLCHFFQILQNLYPKSISFKMELALELDFAEIIWTTPRLRKSADKTDFFEVCTPAQKLQKGVPAWIRSCNFL